MQSKEALPPRNYVTSHEEYHVFCFCFFGRHSEQAGNVEAEDISYFDRPGSCSEVLFRHLLFVQANNFGKPRWSCLLQLLWEAGVSVYTGLFG